ncbi:uncharacterized protein LOC141953001 [Strix uralensis]|uniref:uncharacterized protein LOC141953001 n=1 Tax=Strix uralensis TaxID=36305 RepID=UPI003DA78FE0
MGRAAGERRGGAGSAPRLAALGGSPRPGGGSRVYFYLGDMRSVSCLDFQRWGAEESAGAAAHGARRRPGRAGSAHPGADERLKRARGAPPRAGGGGGRQRRGGGGGGGERARPPRIAAERGRGRSAPGPTAAPDPCPARAGRCAEPPAEPRPSPPAGGRRRSPAARERRGGTSPAARRAAPGTETGGRPLCRRPAELRDPPRTGSSPGRVRSGASPPSARAPRRSGPGRAAVGCARRCPPQPAPPPSEGEM